MKWTTPLALAGLAGIIIIGVYGAQAYAQTLGDIEVGIHHYILSVTIFVGAGIVYSAIGWIRRARAKLAGADVKFNVRKAGMSTLLGLGLGVGAFIWTWISGTPLATTDPMQAAILWTTATNAVLYIDKIVMPKSNTDSAVPAEAADLHDTPMPPESVA